MKISMIKKINKCFPARNIQNYIELAGLTTEPRIISTNNIEDDLIGISTKQFGKIWFVSVDGKKMLFKTFENSDISSTKIRSANEIICCAIAKELNIKCANYKYAKFNNIEGVVSYNFLEDDEKILTCDQLLNYNDYISQKKRTYENIVNTISKINDMNNNQNYPKQKNNIDMEQVKFDIYKLAIFQLLTMQTDGHSNNINFIYKTEEGKKELKVAPLFDNEYAFALKMLEYYEIHKSFNEKKFKSVLDNYYRFDRRIHFLGDGKNFVGYCPTPKQEIDIALLYAKDNANYMNFLINVVNLDMEKVFDNVLQQNPIISSKYKKMYTNIYAMQSNAIKNEMTKLQKNEEMFMKNLLSNEDISEIFNY